MNYKPKIRRWYLDVVICDNEDESTLTILTFDPFDCTAEQVLKHIPHINTRWCGQRVTDYMLTEWQ